MNFVKSRYEGNDEYIYVIPSGDWHIGHLNYREDIVIEQFISKLSNNVRGVLTGDLLEVATKTSIGKGLFDTNMTPKVQKEYLTELLRPVAQFIDGAVIGNHEERIEKETSLDLIYDVCRELSIPYFHYSGYIKYAWNGVAYTLKVRHGNGGGATAQTAIKKCEDMGRKSTADIFCIGHFHKLIKSDRIIEVPDTRNMRIAKQQQHFICCGSALDYDDGYAEMTDLEQRKLGFPIIQMRGEKGNKDIKVTL